jgi:hypothetical protein
MGLLNLYKNSPKDILSQTIYQIVSNAGDGNLLDASTCSDELRTFLSLCPAENLFLYADQCLEKAFTNSGLALQDIINEFGRRLDFDVEGGLYRGKKNAIGFDGIWRAKEQPELIVEVKTTDYVTIDLDKHAGYKERLVAENRVTKNASTLIVVGREDTGALEAQIRGSRFAWEMRLISVDRLAKLVQIKEKSDDSATVNQIRQLLQPFEYTKIDRIIDVIFTTTKDVERQQEAELTQEAENQPASGSVEDREPLKQVRTDLEALNAKRQQAAESFAASRGKALIRRSTTFYSSPDKNFRVCCAVSKRYKGDYQPYWYAYHPTWDAFLAEGLDSFFILTCMDRNEAYAVPYSWLAANKQNLNMTDRGEKSYWHIPVTTLANGNLAINTSKIGAKTALKPFAFPLK